MNQPSGNEIFLKFFGNNCLKKETTFHEEEKGEHEILAQGQLQYANGSDPLVGDRLCLYLELFGYLGRFQAIPVREEEDLLHAGRQFIYFCIDPAYQLQLHLFFQEIALFTLIEQAEQFFLPAGLHLPVFQQVITFVPHYYKEEGGYFVEVFQLMVLLPELYECFRRKIACIFGVFHKLPGKPEYPAVELPVDHCKGFLAPCAELLHQYNFIGYFILCQFH